MAETTKLLGDISAIHSLLENFPMSILDMSTGKTYHNAFELMLDILNECGVTKMQLFQDVISKMYGNFNGLNRLYNELYDKVIDKENLFSHNTDEIYSSISEMEVNEQSKFLSGLEEGVKGIFMGIFTSLFTCSAVPLFPNDVFDPNELYNHIDEYNYETISEEDAAKLIKAGWDKIIDIDKLKTLSKNRAELLMEYTSNLASGITIPVKILDIFGMLDISPTSKEGQMYYNVKGEDKYYQKVLSYEKELIETKIYKLYLYVSRKPSSNSNESSKNVGLSLGVYDKDGTTTSITYPLSIEISYKNTDNEDVSLFANINQGGSKSSEVIINATNWKKFNYIKINGNEGYFSFNNNSSCAYFCGGVASGENVLVDNYFPSWTESLKIETPSSEQYYYTSGYSYSQIPTAQITSAITSIAKRVNYIPTNNVTENSTEVIVSFISEDPNTLYTNFDLNAFIWYTIRKGKTYSQIELNHTMWDSRKLEFEKLKKSKQLAATETTLPNSMWNKWYNSKKSSTDEFKDIESATEEPIIDDTAAMYPIAQLYTYPTTNRALMLKIPSQRYFMPSSRNKYITKGGNVGISLNACVYTWDWEYLKSITIFRPKILLASLVRHMIGLTYGTFSSVNISLTRSIIEGKIKDAIKNIIEADDQNIEDCYTAFSNEDFNAMLQETLLSKYNASYYGGESSTVKTHDISEYVNLIDEANSSTSVCGTTATITKLVTEVSKDADTETTNSYGVQIGSDSNILNNLVYALVMPIVESIFTPQIMLLVYTNYELLGLVNINDFAGTDLTVMLNLFMNKMLGISKSVIKYVKDMLLEILLDKIKENLLPLLIEKNLILDLERLNYRLRLLAEARKLWSLYKSSTKKNLSSTYGGDYVNYADITDYTGTDDEQTSPESSSC